MTALITPWGLYEFVRLPMGLTDAAQAFQCLMDEATNGLDFAFVYLNDILIASKSEHKKHLHALFKRLSDYGLAVNPDKCLLGQVELSFLGYKVNGRGTTPLDSKVKDIVDFPAPLAPNKQSTSPSLTSKERLLRAVKSSNFLVIF